MTRPLSPSGKCFRQKHVDTNTRQLTPEERQSFRRHGFVIIRGLASEETCAGLQDVIHREVGELGGPIEYEADLGYPGAPSHRADSGGETTRRLQQAIDRHPLFADWATDRDLVACLSCLLGPDLVLPLAHHNCVMTKQPKYSSRTGWHQDFRYWSFARPELVSAWLALGPETAENGSLDLIPGSHSMTLDSERFDQQQFFREDLSANQDLIGTRQSVTLQRGDVLLFHCLSLHSAGTNQTDTTKYSVVFTYRSADNPPSPGSRSASLPGISLAAPPDTSSGPL